MNEENIEISNTEASETTSRNEEIIQEDTDTVLSSEEFLLDDTESSADISYTEIDTEILEKNVFEFMNASDASESSETIEIVTQTVAVDTAPIIEELQHIHYDLLIIIFLLLFFWILQSMRNGIRNFNKWTK